MTPVTDPGILQQLNAAPPPGMQPVTDPAILSQLNGSQSDSNQLSDAASAFGHHLLSPVFGLTQLIQHGYGAAANAISPDSLFTNSMNNIIGQHDSMIAQREKDYQAKTPDSAGAYVGAAAGELAPFLVDAPVKGLQAVGDAAAKFSPEVLGKLGERTASGAAQGATIAATQPVTDGDFGEGKVNQLELGGETGGAVPNAAAGARALGNLISPIILPTKSLVAPMLRKMIGNDPEMLAKLQNPESLVSGSNPTTAQIVQNPDIVQAEKAIANNPNYKGSFEDRNIQNNDARLAAINNIAGSPQAIADALKNRSGQAAEWTGVKDAQGNTVIPGKLETGNPVDTASIAASLDKLKNSPLGLRPAIGGAVSDMQSAIQGASTKDQNGNMVISPGHLDALRQNAKDFMAKYSPNGVVSSQQEAAFVPIKNKIVDAIEGANPGYRDYVANYAKNSVPINTMESAQTILGNVSDRALNAGGSPQLNLAKYNTELGKALNGKYPVSPAAQTALTAVQKDLQRATISNSVRTPGSDTAYNLQAPGWLAKQLYGENFEGGSNATKAIFTAVGAGLGHLISPGEMAVAGAGGGAGLGASMKLGQVVGNKANAKLAEALLNPQKAVEILKKYPANSPMAKAINSKYPQIGALLLSKEATQ